MMATEEGTIGEGTIGEGTIEVDPAVVCHAYARLTQIKPQC